MGLFRRAKVNRFSDAEQQWVNLYVTIYESFGHSLPDAREVAESAMDTAIRESKEIGTYELPINLGDLVLSDRNSAGPFERKIDGLRATLSTKRLDGMTDTDFREYWNALEVSRIMAINASNVVRFAMFMSVMESGIWDSIDEASAAATAKVQLVYGSYAYPSPDQDISDPNRPLPFEVRTRVNEFINERMAADPGSLNAALEAIGGRNALYRQSLTS